MRVFSDKLLKETQNIQQEEEQEVHIHVHVRLSATCTCTYKVHRKFELID